MKRRFFLVLGLVSVVACAAGTPRPEEKPVSVPPTIATGETTVGEPPTRDVNGTPYAASPLTDLANALTKLASTVLDGNPPPSGPIPIQRIRPGRKLVDTSSGIPPKSSELEFLVFGIQMSVVFDEGVDPNISAGSPGPPPAPEDGAVRTTLLLGKTGIKIVELDLRSGRKTQKLPGWLAGANPVGSELADAARRGRLESMLVGESERGVLGNDKLFELAQKERPKADLLREVEAAVKKYPRVSGIEVDELYLLARSRTGGVWIFELNIDEEDGQIVLDSSPLVSVDRRDPDDRMGHPVDSPSPPPPPPPRP